MLVVICEESFISVGFIWRSQVADLLPIICLFTRTAKFQKNIPLKTTATFLNIVFSSGQAVRLFSSLLINICQVWVQFFLCVSVVLFLFETNTKENQK